MRRKLQMCVLKLLVFIVMGSFVAQVSAADTARGEHTQVYRQISAELNQIAKMLTDGTSPEAVLRYCCTSDYVADGQGYKTPVSGAALLPLQTEEMSELKAPCEFTINGPVQSSGVLASAFATLKCRAAKKGAPEFVQKSIFVWRLTPHGWMMVQEMDVYPNEKSGS